MDASSRRKTMAHSTKNGQNANEKQKNASAKGTTSNYAEEQKMAIVLFFIVALYLGGFALGLLSKVLNSKVLFFRNGNSYQQI